MAKPTKFLFEESPLEGKQRVYRLKDAEKYVGGAHILKYLRANGLVALIRQKRYTAFDVRDLDTAVDKLRIRC